MTIKIEKKIVRYAVQKPEAPIAPAKPSQAEVKAAALAVSAKPVEKIIAEKRPKAEVIRMHEKLELPDMLIGSTYKVKTPVSDHAMYITINDILLNEGTPYEQRRPFEIFINSKNL
ncbi:MAG: NrdJb, partial [Gammaproteobacteria bacterium]|nr:NrdJb [Gammaproteobacteria bacterium]